jgi:hypothetical protein
MEICAIHTVLLYTHIQELLSSSGVTAQAVRHLSKLLNGWRILLGKFTSGNFHPNLRRKSQILKFFV